MQRPCSGPWGIIARLARALRPFCAANEAMPDGASARGNYSIPTRAVAVRIPRQCASLLMPISKNPKLRFLLPASVPPCESLITLRVGSQGGAEEAKEEGEKEEEKGKEKAGCACSAQAERG